MVAGLRHFALNTGCWLIAEGVETAEEMQTLRELDVRYVQGYLLGRPAPAHELDGVATVATPSGGAAPSGLTGARTRRR
jgi:EAL domain-containing protein (putative c-di-GMP-specific phosphodiesterase class I)